MSQTLENYFIGQKEDLLLEQAENISQEYLEALGRGLVNLDQFAFELEALDRYLNADIWMINRRGQVYINSGRGELSSFIENVNIEEIQEVFQGNIVKREGTFRGYFQEPVLTIGYPVPVGDEVILGLFIHASIPEIQSSADDIRRITLVSLLISSAIAFILVLYISRNLTKEIARINEGVHHIAKGNFDKRLEITREDELGELAENFNEMVKELNQSEVLRRNFISNISHDLRSPLTSISGFVEGILDGTIEREKQDHYLKKVLQESKRLTKLTNDILDLSKLESGQLRLKITPFDIHALLVNQVDQFERRIQEKDIDLSLTFAQERIKTCGDIEAIQRVIYNLIDNAVKFTEPQGKINIRTYYRENKVFVAIRNSGKTLAPEELRPLFERFHKGDTSRGKDKQGSGLGLSIVKEIIKAHGGDIQAYSNDDIGVEFVFSLFTIRS